MLSKHPGNCRFPHGHTRRIEIVLVARQLDANDMVVDFSALKLAMKDFIDMFDHSMAINSNDPMMKSLVKAYGDAMIVYEDQDPTTEVIARDIFEAVAEILRTGWKGKNKDGLTFSIPAGRTQVERVRVWETPSSWAEFGID